MRKFTIILTVLIAMTIKANSQIPNNGFENWITVGAYDSIAGGVWGTTNFFATGPFYPITKSTDHYPHNVGNYSLRLENRPLLSPSFSAAGIAMTNFQFDKDAPAFPITGHPTILYGYYKFIPENNDTMFIKLKLFHNGSMIASATFFDIATVSTWTSFNIPIPEYTIADSAYIAIFSFFPGDPVIIRGNSVLYIDNLSFDSLITSTPTSIANLSTKNTLFNIYPNPASDIVTLNIDNRNNADLTLNIYNLIGELVRSELLKQNQQKINIGDLNNGIYMIEIKSKEWSKNQKLIIQR